MRKGARQAEYDVYEVQDGDLVKVNAVPLSFSGAENLIAELGKQGRGAVIAGRTNERNSNNN